MARTVRVADADVLGVRETDDGYAVQLNNGSVVLVREDGHYRLTDHDNEQKRLPLWEGEVSSDESETDFNEDEDESEAESVPDGPAHEVLEWVGDDPDRAGEALETEQSRDKPRIVLVKQLERTIGEG